MNKRPLNIVIAGGGTGGHLFPGIAVAQTFKIQNRQNRILFVSTGRPLELSVLSRMGFKHQPITAQGIKGLGLWRKLGSIFKLPQGIIESAAILNRFKPDLVIGLGGYSSGPVIITAWLLGIKTILMEQNILPGITNRILANFADRIYVAFENTKFRCASAKIKVAGNPVRKEISDCRRRQWSNVPSTSKRPFTVLILGGSQGAHNINTAVTGALNHLNARHDFRFIHQTGAADEKWVRKAYEESGATFSVQAFYNNMADLYTQSDLIICRAGATTVAEITAIGKGAVFVPYPFAADNHQFLNAQALVVSEAAEMILDKDLTAQRIARRIEYLKRDPAALKRMASKAKQLGRTDAAAFIVRDCCRMLSTENM